MQRKPTLPQATLTRWLADHWPDARNLRPHQEGTASQVFTFSARGHRYVLRLNRDGDGFLKDRFCHARFSHVLPIPQLVESGRIEDLHFAISEYLAEDTVQDLSIAELPAMVPQVRKLWHQLTHVDVSAFDGFGTFDATGKTAHYAWHDVLLTTVSDKRIVPLLAKCTVSERECLTRVIARYRELIPGCPDMRCLYHGDFGSNNLLVRDGRLVGVIDWDCAGIGDPLMDVAGAGFWSHHLVCMQQQAADFDAHLSLWPGYRDRLLCYQLRIGLEELHEAGDDAGSAATRDGVFRRLTHLADTSQPG